MDHPQKQESSLPHSEEVGASSAKVPTAQEVETQPEVAIAHTAVREGQISTAQGSGESLNAALRRDLNSRSSRHDRTPSQVRASVIAQTPRSVTTSTPQNSPPPPLPPRNCQTLGIIQIPAVPHPSPCSLSCSELSSVGGDVFLDDQQQEDDIPWPINQESSFPIASNSLPVANPSIIVTTTMDAAQAEIEKKHKKLIFKINNFQPEDVDSETVDDYRNKLLEIQEIHESVAEAVDQLTIDYSLLLETTDKDAWTDQLRRLQTEVREHRPKIKNKAVQVREEIANHANLAVRDNTPFSTTPTVETEKLDLLRRQVQAMEVANQNSQAEKADRLSDTIKETDDKRASALAKAKAKFGSIDIDVEELEEKLSEVTDWPNESNLSVGRAMRNIAAWREEFQKLVALSRELKEVVSENNFTEDELNFSYQERVITTLQEEMKATIAHIEEEDDNRALYTLDKSKTDPVKLPVFKGEEHEDYLKFKDEIQKGFVLNRICRDDQLPKLRECLRKHALNLVPESTVTKVEEAWKVLDQAFGDATKLLKYRWKELSKLGTLPSHNQSKGHTPQIEWYLQMENILRNIISLGQRSTKLGDEVFRDASICTVLIMFPVRLRTKLKNCRGERREKMEAVLEKVAEFRSEAQELQQIDEAAGLNIGKGEGNKVESINNQIATPAFKPPRRDDKCRICTTLETQGDTDDLYEDHLHDFPSGCPRYIRMSVEDRFQIATKAKLCLKCHNPEYIYVPRDQKHQCSKSKRFSCKKCSLHMWICRNHKDDNKDVLQKFRDDYQKDFNLRFGLFVGQISLVKGSKPIKQKKMKSRSGFKKKKVVIEVEAEEEIETPPDISISSLPEQEPSSEEYPITSPNKTRKRKSTSPEALEKVETAASCNHEKKNTFLHCTAQ